MYEAPICNEVAVSVLPNYSELVTASGVPLVILIAAILILVPTPVY